MASIKQPIDRVFARSRAAVAATMFLVATVSVSVWSGRAFSDDMPNPMAPCGNRGSGRFRLRTLRPGVPQPRQAGWRGAKRAVAVAKELE